METKRMNGKSSRVMETAMREFVAASSMESVAGEVDDPRRDGDAERQMTPRMRMSVERTTCARCHEASGPSFAHVLVKVVVNAVESAPSAKRSRSRFGMRNAAMKTSESVDAPNMKAKTCSRTTPIRREPITARPTTAAERFELRGGGHDGEASESARSGGTRKLFPRRAARRDWISRSR